MPMRYVLADAEMSISEQVTVDIYSCPDCGFEFNAHHVCDDEIGGYECPECEVIELTEKLKKQQEDHDYYQRLILEEKVSLQKEFDQYKDKIDNYVNNLKEYKNAYYSLRTAGVHLPYISQSLNK